MSSLTFEKIKENLPSFLVMVFTMCSLQAAGRMSNNDHLIFAANLTLMVWVAIEIALLADWFIGVMVGSAVLFPMTIIFLTTIKPGVAVALTMIAFVIAVNVWIARGGLSSALLTDGGGMAFFRNIRTHLLMLFVFAAVLAVKTDAPREIRNGLILGLLTAVSIGGCVWTYRKLKILAKKLRSSVLSEMVILPFAVEAIITQALWIGFMPLLSEYPRLIVGVPMVAMLLCWFVPNWRMIIEKVEESKRPWLTALIWTWGGSLTISAFALILAVISMLMRMVLGLTP